MMKKIFCASLFLTVFTGYLGINGVSTSAPFSKKDDLNTPATTVKKFWEASLEGNQSQIDDLTTSQPESFSDKEVRCKSAHESVGNSGKVTFRKDTVSVLPLRRQKDEFTLYFSSMIKKDNLKFVKAQETSVYEDEAVVQAKYKLKNSETSIFFLLYRENADWKIFMISDGYAIFNPNYAKEECLE